MVEDQDLMQETKIVVDLEVVQVLEEVQVHLVRQETNQTKILVLVDRNHNMEILVVMHQVLQYFLVLVAVVLMALVVMEVLEVQVEVVMAYNYLLLGTLQQSDMLTVREDIMEQVEVVEINQT